MTQRRDPLAKRNCRNCGARFQPRREDQNFCSASRGNCRKEYHKYGGAFAKLKVEMEKQIRRRIHEINPRDPETFAALVGRVNKLERFVSAIRKAVEEEHGV